jgi:hypothetical protein
MASAALANSGAVALKRLGKIMASVSWIGVEWCAPLWREREPIAFVPIYDSRAE